jgi:hypothetical protein
MRRTFLVTAIVFVASLSIGFFARSATPLPLQFVIRSLFNT